MKSKGRSSASHSSKASWGGKRDGAGRPQTSPFVPHATRPRIERRRSPVQITLKLRSGLPSLRDENIFDVFEKACLRARRFGLRIIEYTVLSKAIHMICEFKKTEELEKSFKSLNTSLAVALKKTYKAQSGTDHRGPVFLGRYKMKVLSHPDEMKLALREVLLLPYESKENIAPTQKDHFSSGVLFERWQALLGKEITRYPALEEHPKEDVSARLESAKKIAKRITASPQFWLSQAGWLRSHLDAPQDFKKVSREK